MPGLTPDQVQRIHELLHNRRLMEAVKVYHDATGVSLAEAKEAVEEMAYNEQTKAPPGTRRYDDPVLEGKIKSLLSKGKKLDAIQIYRAEYGTSPQEAQKAVERLEASMPRDSATSQPYESAIGRDPFAEDETAGRRRFVFLGIALMLTFCALGSALLILLASP